ncbi:hypothetical protein [Cupriavidus basilensis]|uniref:Phage protein n=1 Tax=Cupriavidus basilensis TaxID=68895 RepID=A0A0C4Y1B8_9BURK|nr:hypothetical protein [Cupriavidus basilensis]AJG18837.1 hypothetical protein RR42_m1436 [Cupriavidus basilensis]
MGVNTAAYLNGFYDTTRAMGDKAVSSDGAFEIEGFEDMWLLTKSFPWPTISPAGEIEVPTPLGGGMWQPQQVKVNLQGQITLMETSLGSVSNMLIRLIAQGARFNAKAYEGTPDRYRFYHRLKDCFIQTDIQDRDFENRSQILTISGTMYFHYFGEKIVGNIT